MDEIKGHARYLDPPDPPTHGLCNNCGEIFDYGDLTNVGDVWLCVDCLHEYMDENKKVMDNINVKNG